MPGKGLHDYPIVIGGGPKASAPSSGVRADERALALEMLDDSGKVVGRLRI